MTASHDYRVTRRGEDIYVGDEEGLLEAARKMEVLANDLIYNPLTEKWVFARSLPLLAGFALRGKRAVGRAIVEREQGVRFTERAVAHRAAKRRAVIRATGTVLLAVATVTLVIFIPVTRPLPKAMKQFIGAPGADSRGAEADGRMPPRLAKSGATTLGRRSALAIAPGMAGAEGTGEGNAVTGGAGKGKGTGGGTGGGTGAGTRAGKGPGASKGGAERGAGDVSAPGASTGRSTPGRKGASAPASTKAKTKLTAPPAQLLRDFEAEARPGMLDQPKDSERKRYAYRYSAEAMRMLSRANPSRGQARLKALMAARNKALFANDNFEALGDAEEQVRTTGKLIEEIEIEYLRLCEPTHEERFCELKLDHPEWSDSAVRQISDDRVVVGMSETQVRAAWGEPAKILIDTAGRRLCYGTRCARWVATIAGTVVDSKD
jgi:hypothetical protein